MQLTFPKQDAKLSLNHFFSTSASCKVCLLNEFQHRLEWTDVRQTLHFIVQFHLK